MPFPPKLLLLLAAPLAVSAAIMGVDLGSLYMKVALVQSGSPLQIVTNLHSKRKTEQIILFDRNQRFYGADANALLARKSHLTPAAMSLMLGRDDEHPSVRVLSERHYPVIPAFNETRKGVTITVDGHEFTPEELVAMVLTHAVDISVAYATEQGTANMAPPKDVVLTIPCYATQVERRALIDAAKLADLNVLTLIEENTAAALQFAMDKNFEDGEKLYMFYNMGASALQVSLVRFFNYDAPQKYGKPKSTPALEVIAKSWDTTLGGNAFDHVLTEYFADQFNQNWQKLKNHKKDVRDNIRAMTKLRLQAHKTKHVLSANAEMPIYIESVLDDTPLSVHMSRDLFEQLSAPLLERAIKPVTDCLEHAKLTSANLTAIELIGGGMRIPSVQNEIQKAIGEQLELGLHMNADESMALGAAFAGANISTAFRVRQVGMTDINTWGVSVSLSDNDDSSDEWKKDATLFKSNSKVGVKKTIAFTHDKDVHCELDYIEDPTLPQGTELTLDRYDITGVADFAKDMAEKGLGKPKVSLQFELSQSGITSLIKAEAAVEETYTVQEEVEETSSNSTETESNETADATTNETDAPVEKKKTMVEKLFGTRHTKPAFLPQEKKRVHKRALSIANSYASRVQPHSPELFEASRSKLLEMAQRDKERMMLEEAKNRVESYMYYIKNKLIDDADAVEKVSTEEQREQARELSSMASDWLDDEGYDADLETMVQKYNEISGPFEKILDRVRESTARPAAVAELQKKLQEVEALMTKWETTKPQVTAAERDEVLQKVSEARDWMAEKEEEQAKKAAHEDAVFTSAEVPLQLKRIENLVLRLSRKPKPKIETPKQNTTSESNETTTSNETTSEAGEETASEEKTTDETASKEDTAGYKSTSEEETTSKDDVEGEDEL